MCTGRDGKYLALITEPQRPGFIRILQNVLAESALWKIGRCLRPQPPNDFGFEIRIPFAKVIAFVVFTA
jgi:hypothetical protein